MNAVINSSLQLMTGAASMSQTRSSEACLDSVRDAHRARNQWQYAVVPPVLVAVGIVILVVIIALALGEPRAGPV